MVDITNINEAESKFDVELDVIALWQEPPGSPIDRDRPRTYTGAAAESQMGTIWSPQIIAANAVGTMALSRVKMSTRPDGRVELQARVYGALRAPFNFRRFPFDAQRLTIHLEPFAWNAETVRLEQLPDGPGSMNPSSCPNGPWMMCRPRCPRCTPRGTPYPSLD